MEVYACAVDVYCKLYVWMCIYIYIYTCPYVPYTCATESQGA